MSAKEKSQSFKISAVSMSQLNEICARCKPLGKQGLVELAIRRLSKEVKEKGLNALEEKEGNDGHNPTPVSRPLDIARAAGASRLPLRR